ncbi:hypothetical protein BOTBODRAFT_38140 [Botryobasidium botryosum FD-172 SS1]|uniref:Uncharacterized protein n=1 Tax=Botryobasidium botryosum (strain FD-172 SS1) TaxID=930990 RepID=A0A067LXN7_BOTB1|nr:hypothetical protein BOTBODRAFT_38140 [Botryobasidium botryosum FD-172 SS1]
MSNQPQKSTSLRFMENLSSRGRLSGRSASGLLEAAAYLPHLNRTSNNETETQPRAGVLAAVQLSRALSDVLDEESQDPDITFPQATAFVVTTPSPPSSSNESNLAPGLRLPRSRRPNDANGGTSRDKGKHMLAPAVLSEQVEKRYFQLLCYTAL